MGALRIISVLVMLVTMVVVVSGASSVCIETFSVKGRIFTVVNKPFRPEDGVVCPEAKPNKVIFCNNGKVTIVGNFAAPDLGVCNPKINPYTLPLHAQVTYEQYGDQVIFRVPDRVASSFRVLIDNYKKVAVGLSSQRYGVSYLTDAGTAYC